MARPIRVQCEGALYHITARGNERRRIFHAAEEMELFLDTLGQCAALHGLVVHGYCLMPNHYHLLAETPRGNLTRAIGWLQTTYTIRLNRRRRRSGHLFQGRFKAHLIDGDDYAMTLLRYIHLNPVRPRDKQRAVPAQRWSLLKQYPWSSHRAYAGWEEGPPWLDLQWLLLFGARRTAAHKEYRAFVRAGFEEELDNPWSSLRGGLLLGGEDLWKKVAGLIGQKRGQEELRWNKANGDHASKRMELARTLAAKEGNQRLKVWLRVCLGGERRIDVARSYGYADGSAVTHLLKRLKKEAAFPAVQLRYEHRFVSTFKS
jgi:putative transposase